MFDNYYIGTDLNGYVEFEDPEDIMEEVTFRIRSPHSEDRLKYNSISNQTKLIKDEWSIEIIASRKECINDTLSHLPLFSLYKFQCGENIDVFKETMRPSRDS